MLKLDGKPLPYDRAFTHNGTQYPASWLRHATLSEKNVIGITEVRGDNDWSQFAKHIEERIRKGDIDESVVVTGIIKEHEHVLAQLQKLLLVGNGQWLDA